MLNANVCVSGAFTLAQTPIICRYLGKQFGLFPESDEDQWHGEQINATVHDYIAEGKIQYITSFEIFICLRSNHEEFTLILLSRSTGLSR